MIEQIRQHKISENGSVNGKVNFALRLSLVDGSIEVDSSLKEITLEDLRQFMPKGDIFNRTKLQQASIAEDVDPLGR